jgi:CRISPR-associated protein Cmr1
LEKISLECVVLTPMFLAGADTEYPEIRAASIKGMLRFWWRALHAHLPLNDLRNRETEIFGGAGEGAGRSKLEISLKNVKTIFTPNQKLPYQKAQATHNGKTIPINLFNYLAYGVVDYNREIRDQVLNRPFIEPSSFFLIEFNFPKKYRGEIIQTIRAFFSFGNLGAKSRNGFGSFYLKDTTFKIEEKSLKIEKLKELIIVAPSADYSAFTTQSKLYKTPPFDSVIEAWGKIGEVYRDVRLSLDPHYQYDKRKYIAQPIEKMNKSDPIYQKRYAKPYFLKVLPEGGKFVGYILFLPSNYGVGLISNPANQLRYDADAKIVHSQINLEFKSRLTEVV